MSVVQPLGQAGVIRLTSNSFFHSSYLCLVFLVNLIFFQRFYLIIKQKTSCDLKN